jgi:hypothetical protein
MALPLLALTALFTAAVVLPALALGVAAAVVIGPPYATWRLATRARTGRRREAGARAALVSRMPPGTPDSGVAVVVSSMQC